MATLEFSAENPLGSSSAAVSRLQELFPELEKKYGELVTDLSHRWEGSTNTFKFKAKGHTLTGILYVEDRTIDVVAEVPFVVSLLKGRVEDMFKQKIKELLAS